MTAGVPPDPGDAGRRRAGTADPTRRFALAIDLGTTALKVGVVSLTGSLAFTTGAQLTTTFTAGGGAEQDADAWWRLVVDACRRAVASGAVAAEEVVAVSVTGQWASTVPVDEAGRPVGPCVLWMDTRGGPHVRRRFGGPVAGYSARTLAVWVRTTGGAPSTSGADPVGHMLHLQHDRPDVAGAARWYLEPVDYLTMRFTGAAAATPASMTAAWLTDNRHPERIAYDDRLVGLSGIDPTKLPPLRRTASVVGTVRPEVAAELGLGPEVAVVAGTPDLHSAAVGAGTSGDYRCHLAISTTSWVSCPVAFKKTDALRQIASVPGVAAQRYLVANNHETAGACLQWLRDRVIDPGDGLGPAAGSGSGFDQLTALAATVPPGSGRVIFTPWLAGERSPVDDRHARGGFHNLSLDADRAVLVRSVLEGVAYNNRWLHRAVERFVGRRLEPIRVFGGGAQSDLWCQIHADVLGRRVERPVHPVHTGLRGAAVLAGIAVGAVDPATADQLTEVEATFEPQPAAGAVYERLYREFPRLYRTQKAMFRRLNRR